MLVGCGIGNFLMRESTDQHSFPATLPISLITRYLITRPLRDLEAQNQSNPDWQNIAYVAMLLK
jgi:hypothetical protein